MDNTELVSIIRAHRNTALGTEDSALSSERAKALDHYYGRPYGNEIEGRSAVVSRDLSEAVDWAMPALIKIFTQSGNIAEFIPAGPEDEQGSEQESDYVNHVIMVENNGVLLLHDAFKDALILKNYYFKHYIDESEKVTEEEYSGLTDDELAYLVAKMDNEGEAEVVEHDEVTEEIQGMPVILHDIKIRIKRKTKRVRIEVVPPEEIRVSKRCRGSLQESPFTEHVTRKTRSELIEMGMKRDWVDDLPAYNEDDNDQEVNSRDTVNESEDNDIGTSYDRSMDEIEYCESYIRVDYDGDGVAELRKVITCANRIPPGPEWNEVIDCVPLTSGSPKRVPHRHVGESLDDELSDLQEIKTTLFRQMLDNIYRTNNAEYIINERVHMPDFLQSLPGGVKRVMDDQPVAGCVEAVQTTPILGQILPAIDYVDSRKSDRTGINESTTAGDPDLIKESTKGAYLEHLNRASQKVEMIARLLGEGVKELVLRVHELLLKHQDKPKVIKLRGEYVTIDPTEWRERTDLRLRVGIGTGSEDEKREKLMLISQMQETLLKPFGLVMPQQAYSLFTDVAKTLGFEAAEKWGLNPESPEYQQLMQMQSQQQQPNPLAEVEQIKGQFLLQKESMQQEFKAMVEQIRQNQEHTNKMAELQVRLASEAADRASREAIEVAKLEIQALIEGFKTDLGKPGIGAGLQDDT